MKKFLSIILAAVMIAAMLPAGIVSASEEEFEGYNYVFTAEAFPESLKNSNGYVMIENLAAMTTETPLSTVSAPWKVASHNYIAGVQSRPVSGLSGSTYKGFNIYTDTTKNYTCFAIELKVEQGGTYVPSLDYFTTPNAPKVKIWLVKAGTESGGKSTADFNFSNTTSDRDGDLWTFINNISGETNGVYILKDELDMHGEFTQEKPAVTENFGNRAIELEGTSYYLLFHKTGSDAASGTLQIPLKSFSLTPIEDVVTEEFTPSVDNTTPVTNSASVKMLAYYGDTSDPIGDVENVTYGESVEIPAPERTVEMGGKTYTFRYWTKGLETGIANRQAISTALSFDYMPHEGANFLIAVYEEEGNAKEAFYNYNGQLLTDLAIVDNKLPLLPSMAGFGSAQKWEQLGTGDLFEENADVTELSGDKVFMAKYGDKISNITINGNTYAYGDPVECKSTDPNFSYWTRTIDGVREIVSVSPNYTFRAFTDCTVEAVCVGKIEVESPCKILLSTFSVGDMTAVMAEFIGFEDAKEKGIMFGTQKIAMTTDYAQFTVTNDTTDDVEVKGYAVVEGERLVSDSITVAGKGSAE